MEVYLTKMTLNPRSRQVRSEIGNPQELHRTLSRGFPAIENGPDVGTHERKTPRSEFNILHRLEINRKNGSAVLLVQSTREPIWDWLEEDYADDIAVKRIDENLSAIRSGQRLYFRIQANPTKRFGNSYEFKSPDDRNKYRDSKKRRRVPIYDEQERISWLDRQGELNGFRLCNLNSTPAVRNMESVQEEKVRIEKKDPTAEKQKRRITIGSVVFEGILEVTDPDKFRGAIECGIGQGKAYGFGLLSVAPIRNSQ